MGSERTYVRRRGRGGAECTDSARRPLRRGYRSVTPRACFPCYPVALTPVGTRGNVAEDRTHLPPTSSMPKQSATPPIASTGEALAPAPRDGLVVRTRFLPPTLRPHI